MRSIRTFFKGFVYAYRGIVISFAERNMRVHGFATVVTLTAGWFYRISVEEWLVVLLLIGAIWSAEMVNTALEEICNIMNACNDLHYSVTTKARDIAAGSVLVLAVVAVVCGALIFLPKMGG